MHRQKARSISGRNKSKATKTQLQLSLIMDLDQCAVVWRSALGSSKKKRRKETKLNRKPRTGAESGPKQRNCLPTGRPTSVAATCCQKEPKAMAAATMKPKPASASHPFELNFAWHRISQLGH